MNKLVLVADDLKAYLDLHAQPLKDAGLEVITASNLVALASRYMENMEKLAAIIIDSRLAGRGLNTLPFIAQAKRGLEAGEFTGILVAASNNAEHRVQMVKLGCTHQAPKADAAQVVLSHFGLTS